jgi:ornithine carbamoyltransferase
MSSIQGKDLITTQDWTVDELLETIKLAKELKAQVKGGKRPLRILDRKNFFMLFYATSTRTRGAFEAAMEILGGHAPYIDVSTTRIKSGEATKDVAKMYDAYGDGLGVRILDDCIDFIYGSGRKVVEEYAAAAKIPVINMACCTYHPTQAIGDFMTIENKIGKLKGKKYVISWAYSSKLRGRCSIQEEALMATRLGMDVVLAHPPGFDIDPNIVKMSKANAGDSGGSFSISNNFTEALTGANVVFPRSWVTSKLSDVGSTAFGVNREIEIHNKYRDWMLEQKHVEQLMSKRSIITHVLPVFRGEEATDQVLDGSNSVIYEQAEDNYYAKMAVLALTMGKVV